jgi:hypothetical protein
MKYGVRILSLKLSYLGGFFSIRANIIFVIMQIVFWIGRSISIDSALKICYVVLSVLLRFVDSDYSFGIYELF